MGDIENLISITTMTQLFPISVPWGAHGTSSSHENKGILLRFCTFPCFRCPFIHRRSSTRLQRMKESLTHFCFCSSVGYSCVSRNDTNFVLRLLVTQFITVFVMKVYVKSKFQMDFRKMCSNAFEYWG